MSIDALNTATPNLADVPPSQMKHRCLEYQLHQTWQMDPPANQGIDVLNPATPNLADGPPANWA